VPARTVHCLRYPARGAPARRIRLHFRERRRAAVPRSVWTRVSPHHPVSPAAGAQRRGHHVCAAARITRLRQKRRWQREHLEQAPRYATRSVCGQGGDWQRVSNARIVTGSRQRGRVAMGLAPARTYRGGLAPARTCRDGARARADVSRGGSRQRERIAGGSRQRRQRGRYLPGCHGAGRPNSATSFALLLASEDFFGHVSLTAPPPSLLSLQGIEAIDPQVPQVMLETSASPFTRTLHRLSEWVAKYRHCLSRSSGSDWTRARRSLQLRWRDRRPESPYCLAARAVRLLAETGSTWRTPAPKSRMC